MHVVDIVIAVGWVALVLYWVIAAGSIKAAQPDRNRTRFIGIRIVVIVVVFGLSRAGLIRGHLGVTLKPWLQGVGLAVFLLGVGLAVWARVYLGRNWGTPMSQRLDPELVITGPYRYVRHPIYSGLILAMIGSAVAVSLYWLVAVAIAGGYFVYSATVEERLMEGLFPETYPAYRRSTKMLIPFVF